MTARNIVNELLEATSSVICPLCGSSVSALPKPPPTVNDMADLLAKGQAVLCPPGKRGRLTGLLKAKQIFTRQQTLKDAERTVLFTPSGPRTFKSGGPAPAQKI